MRDQEMTTEAASEEQWSVGHPGLAAGDSWGDCDDEGRGPVKDDVSARSGSFDG